VSSPPGPGRSATSICHSSHHRVAVEAATRQALVSTLLIATLLISALGLGPLVLPARTDTRIRMRCHERDQARSLARSLRVREIMRPPTNQSIRRHLSDCSLTSVCPAPPFLSSPPRRPLDNRKRTDARHPRTPPSEKRGWTEPGARSGFDLESYRLPARHGNIDPRRVSRGIEDEAQSSVARSIPRREQRTLERGCSEITERFREDASPRYLSFP